MTRRRPPPCDVTGGVPPHVEADRRNMIVGIYQPKLLKTPKNAAFAISGISKMPANSNRLKGLGFCS